MTLRQERTDRKDRLMIAILQRAEYLAHKYHAGFNRMTSALDLEHATRQYPLDLEALLEFPDFDFAHDFFGIRRHMNRDTGLLEDCFVPRCYRGKTNG